MDPGAGGVFARATGTQTHIQGASTQVLDFCHGLTLQSQVFDSVSDFLNKMICRQTFTNAEKVVSAL